MRNSWLLLVFPLSIMLLLTTAGAAFAGKPHAPDSAASPVGTGPAYYTVKANDTLWDIAVKHHTSVEALVTLNPGINPKRLITGQKLRLPGAAGDAPVPADTATYTVRANDTLWDIAARHGVFVNDLMAANPGANPKRLIAGQVLRIPGGAADAAPPAPVAALYTIRADDTLWEIAANYGLYVNDLLAANPSVDPRRLMPGQQIRVPGIAQEVLSAVVPASQPPAAAPEPVPPAPAPADTAAAPEAGPPAAPPAEAAPPPAEAAPAAQPQGLSSELAEWVQEMLNRINEKRVAGGRAALVWNNELALAAQLHAEDCAARNRGSHVGSDGARLRDRYARANYPAQWAGENWANSRSVGHAFDMWWNEPAGADPHVRNIMEGRATEIGIGIARGAWGYYFIADFGSR